MFKELLLKDRSIRRFKQDVVIERSVLEELVDLGRISASGANLQPLKYMLSCDAETNAMIFPHLRWAGYLTEWDGPAEGERPAAYIIVLGDTEISKNFGVDHGIASHSILLGAADKGIGGCMVGSLNRAGLAEALEIPTRYEVLLVLAMGIPAETVKLSESVDSIKYYRNEADVHIVPKRSRSEVILN
ncbi:MAG: nitroreductase family protein [Kiritimatiellales bacterium]|nr:nitroreductase family protein [Kiritimatiellales bacterium]